MVWNGMVWYGNRIIFIAKVLKKLYTKTKMQRFSKTIHKNKDAKVLKNHTQKQRCKGSQKLYTKTKMQRFSNTIIKILSQKENK